MKFISLLICIILIFNNCSAIIERTDQPNIYAEIHSSTKEDLFIKTSNGNILKIKGSNIKDIDHPGNVLFNCSLYILFMALIFASDNDISKGDGKAGIMIFGLYGLPMAAGGAIPYYLSKKAAWNLEY